MENRPDRGGFFASQGAPAGRPTVINPGVLSSFADFRGWETADGPAVVDWLG